MKARYESNFSSLLLLMLIHISFYREESPFSHPFILHLLQGPFHLEKANPFSIVAEDHRHTDTSDTAALLQYFAFFIQMSSSQSAGIIKAGWMI